ncbi:MAG TPA: hypothetical protein VGK75_13920 [Casimicrobiaceae bacterium]
MDLSTALLASAFLGLAVVLANVGLRYLDPAMRVSQHSIDDVDLAYALEIIDRKAHRSFAVEEIRPQEGCTRGGVSRFDEGARVPSTSAMRGMLNSDLSASAFQD